MSATGADEAEEELDVRRARDVFGGTLPDEKVREDPTVVTPAEKETTIRFGKDEDRAHVATAEAGLIRRVLAHRETVVKSLDLLRGQPIRGVDDVEHAANLGEIGVYHFPASRLAAVEEVEA